MKNFEIEPLEIINTIIKAFEDVKRNMHAAENVLSFRNGEYNDLTHALELIPFNAADGYKLAKQMQENRRDRRAAKDMQEVLKPLFDLMNKHQSFFKELKNVHALAESTIRTQQARVYSPRTRTDMQEKFARAKVTL